MKESKVKKQNLSKLTGSCVSMLAMLWLSPALAAPVLNDNVATTGLATIYPDHANPSLYYIAPNVITICSDSSGVPRFSYQDLSVSTGRHAIVQMTVCSQYDKAELEASKAEVLAKNPKAQFASLPFISSQMMFNEILAPLVVKQFCSHTAGTVGDEEACSFRLNNLGRRLFLQNILSRTTMVWQYEYTVAGFMRQPDNSFAALTTTRGLAVRIGGENLSQHPELFRDTQGNQLKIKNN